MKEPFYEVNFDGLPGLTHNYGGLSYGNIASMKHKLIPSNPKKAALQSLHKMKFMTDLGLVQGILPPHERPYIAILRELGFTGSDSAVIENAYTQAPEIFFACCSASAMWAANAATVTPYPDSSDHHLHITPANLSFKFHRSFEHKTTAQILRQIFPEGMNFSHHPPLPQNTSFSDEGAANHTRFCKSYGGPGVHLFVFGRYGFKSSAQSSIRYPARQTFEASQAIVRQHKIFPDRVLFAQQNPIAIDAGVFHNDVVSVGNATLFMYHEKAFLGTETVVEELQQKVRAVCDTDLTLIPISEKSIPLEKAVETYLFNSQIVTIEDNFMAIIAPKECQQDSQACAFFEDIVNDPHTPIKKVHFVDIRESMQNGGGPACLRLRVPMSRNDIMASNPKVFLSEKLYSTLLRWVDQHYRDHLTYNDLRDPQLLFETRAALDELTNIMNLDSIYHFQ